MLAFLNAEFQSTSRGIDENAVQGSLNLKIFTIKNISGKSVSFLEFFWRRISAVERKKSRLDFSEQSRIEAPIEAQFFTFFEK